MERRMPTPRPESAPAPPTHAPDIRPPEAAPPERRERFRETWDDPSTGLAGWLSSVSNNNIGSRFMLLGFIFFLLGGVMALLMRAQLALPENTLLGPEVYNQLFTMHGTTMMFLFVIPLIEGMAVSILPGMLGARDLAYPRVSVFSLWTFLLGGITFFASFLFGTVPSAGWFAYTPLSGAKYSGAGMEFWLIGLGFVEFGGIAAGIEIAVSVLKLRAPGMTLGRMPLFAWAWLVTSIMMVVAFTVLLVATLLLELDRGFGTHFFDPERGGSPLLWQHLFWFFGHPEVYIMFIPATGIVSSILPVFARRPIAGYALIATAIVVTGFVSFGLWVHHMFTTGIPWLSQSFFTAASLTIALASGTQVFAWIATLWGSRPRLGTPLLYCLGFLFLFVLGGLTGVMVAIVPFDLQVHDSYFVVAHFHYVLIGGVLFPVLGGMAYWLPKITGRLLSERLGRWSFWLIFLGFNVAFFPMHLTGLLGMPRRVYTYPPELGVGGLNLISTAGAGVLAAGIVLFVVDFLLSLRRGPRASRDPWGGDTLERAVESPAPQANVNVPFIVRSRHPLWEQASFAEGDALERRAREALDHAPVGWRATLGTEAVSGRPEAIHPIAGPAYAPFFVALGLWLVSVALIADLYLLAWAAAAVGLVALLVWTWTSDREVQQWRESGLEERTSLPVFTTGPKSLIWWGMVGVLGVLATVHGVMLYSYFYLRLYSAEWPQGGLPLPELEWPALALAALAGSAFPLRVAERSVLGSPRRLRSGTGALLAAMALGALYLAFQGLSLATLGYGAGANAYASVFWTASVFLALQVAAGIVLQGSALLRLRMERGETRGFAAVQVETAALYGYFTLVTAAVVFAVLYLAPRF